MDLKQLRTFAAVAELGSLSKASDRLRIAQPALSRQIKLLEHDLGSDLFLRNGRGMVLTDAGRTLLERTGGLIRQLEQVRDDLRSNRREPHGQVTLGMIPTAGSVLSGTIASRVVEELPGVFLRLIEGYSGHLINWLHRGEMDLAVVYDFTTPLHLRTTPLVTEELVVAGAPGSGLKEKGQVTLDWLSEQRLVTASPPHGLRTLLDRTVAKADRKLNVVLEADSYMVLVDLVSRGVGFSVLPASAIRAELADGRLEIARLVDPPVLRRLVLARPNETDGSIATQAVADLILRVVRDLGPETWKPPL